MVTSRVARGLVGLAVGMAALVSIDMGKARSQGSAGSAIGSGSPAVIEMTGEEDEDGSAGSGSAQVAPADPKARAHWLKDQLDGTIALRPLLAAKARIAVAVVDVETGTELYTRDADKGMSLASNAKLLTAIAGLGTLGGGFRWRTAVFIDDKSLDETTGIVKGNLYVRGRGDPTLSVNDLRAVALEIAARGIRTIQGQLIIDASYFDADVDPPHFDEQPKERAAFRAPVASFGVSRSAFLVNVIGEPGGGAKVWIEPDAGDHIKLTKVEVTSISVGRTRLKVDIKPGGPKKDMLEVEVVGQIRYADGHWWSKRRVDDPQRFAAEVFRRALADKGITITKRVIGSGLVPVNAQLVTTHDSLPLSSVIHDMNKASDNYVAETVLKTMGAESRASQAPAPATWNDGQGALQLFLATLGLPPGTYRSDNGSGLFASTEVSANQMVTVLRGAHADYRIGPDLLASLPIGGMDGTLARRWRNSAARGRVRAKTGTLAAVTTLAGFVAIDSKRPLAFAILVNDIPTGQKGPARAMADDMLDAIVAYLQAAAGETK